MSKSKSRRQTTRQSKRARFEASTNTPTRTRSQTNRIPLIIGAGVAILVAVLIVGGILLTQNQGANPASATSSEVVNPNPAGSVASSAGVQTRYTPVQAADGAVRWPVTTFDDGQAYYYSFVDAGKSIDFFVLKSSDGVVRAAFDACDVCFPARRGYRQQGDLMICNNCGQQFQSIKINEIRGGCNPAPLDRAVEGTDLVIRVSDILAGAGYF